MDETSAPSRGEIRTIDGQVCRFIERELEGDKWEVLGPARPPGDVGTAQNAVDFALDELPERHEIQAFLNDWRQGDVTDWPDFVVWLMRECP